MKPKEHFVFLFYLHMSSALRIYIERSGYKKQDIASAIGVSAVTVSNWCSGKARPRDRHLVQLGEVLGVDPDILSGKAPVPLPDTYQEFKAICERYDIGMTDILEFLQKGKEMINASGDKHRQS